MVLAVLVVVVGVWVAVVARCGCHRCCYCGVVLCVFAVIGVRWCDLSLWPFFVFNVVCCVRVVVVCVVFVCCSPPPLLFAVVVVCVFFVAVGVVRLGC